MAAADVLRSESVLGDVPAVESLREDELGFEFVIMFAAGCGVGSRVVRLLRHGLQLPSGSCRRR